MFNLENVSTIRAMWPLYILAQSHSESNGGQKQKLHDLKMDFSNTVCHFHVDAQ